MSTYTSIEIGGGDTNTPLNMRKRLALITGSVNVRNKRLLDGGCGAGEYVQALCNQGADAWGIEYSRDKTETFNAKQLNTGRVLRGDLAHIPWADSSFDVVLLNEVLEHIPDDDRALQEVHRVLRPRGILVVFAPNRLFPFESHGLFLKHSGRRVPPQIPLIPYIPVRWGRHFVRYPARNYWPQELRTLLRRAGFHIVMTGFVWQTFENISGQQGAVLRTARPLLRAVSTTCERVPGLRRFGVSQMIIVRKSAEPLATAA